MQIGQILNVGIYQPAYPGQIQVYTMIKSYINTIIAKSVQ